MDKNSSKARWQRVFKEALDADGWGQSLEAIDSYESLSSSIGLAQDELNLTVDERSVLTKLALVLDGRVAALSDVSALSLDKSRQSGVQLSEVKSLTAVLERLFDQDADSSPQAFPVDMHGVLSSNHTRKHRTESDSYPVDKSQKSELLGGTLLSAPRFRPNHTNVSIQIQKIGLKDAENYIDPRICVFIADRNGSVVDSHQETPLCRRKEAQYVHVNTTVHLQSSLEEIRSKGGAIFFEFKHYKPAKKKLSTRCYTFCEADELDPHNPNLCLELYQKPTDASRKRINLFTRKSLYFHAKLLLNKH